MNKKIAKELVIKWARIIAKGAGTGMMTHPTENEREQILEAIMVMKNLTKHNSRTIQSANPDHICCMNDVDEFGNVKCITCGKAD